MKLSVKAIIMIAAFILVLIVIALSPRASLRT